MGSGASKTLPKDSYLTFKIIIEPIIMAENRDTDLVNIYDVDDLTKNMREIFSCEDDLKIIIKSSYVDDNNNKGIINNKGIYYWFSLDSQNQILMAGIGEARIDNLIYKYEFNFETDEERKTNKLFLESLITIRKDDFIHSIKLLRDPISSILPLKVARIDDLTMNDVALQKYINIDIL
jgi:hypothetical protein